MAIDRKEYLRNYQRNWIATRRAEFMKDKLCVQCGSTEQLQLDHVDPATKISHNVWSWSKVRREAEIAKCQVLCASCHQAKTIRQMQENLPGCGTTASYWRGCRCQSCKDAEAKYARIRRAKKRDIVHQ